MDIATKAKHIGRNICRIRELRGMKQEALAQAIGVSQQTVSNLEASQSLEEEKLIEVANALGVHSQAIKNFSEEGVINYFNTFNDTVSEGVINYFNTFNEEGSENDFSNFNHYEGCTFNALDKLVEAYEENRKLYERLLECEKERVSCLK